MSERVSEIVKRVLELLGPENLRRVLENPRENSLETILVAGILTVVGIIALIILLVIIFKLGALAKRGYRRFRRSGGGS